MLPSFYRQRYQEFQQALEQLYKTSASPEVDAATLRTCFQDVQQLFLEQIAHLSPDELEADRVSRWQSVQTEIHKQMRLLGTDMMMLQASRSSATSQSRAAGASDRIKTLIQYCEALLQL